MTLDELLAASRSGGDPRAGRELADGLYLVLSRFVRERVGPGEVEDLVQSALVVIVRELPRFEPQHPTAFESFVGTVAHRVLLTHRRARAREHARRVDGSPPELATTTRLSEQVARRERGARLRATLPVLDSPRRRAVLDYLADVRWQDQVAREGVARPTLRSRLARAIVQLRREMAPPPTPTPT